jgi:diaminopimelate decarboxylase
MTAAIFFAKTKMSWTERVVNKHAKKDGKPFLVYDARQLIEELDRVAARKSNISPRPD